MKKIIICMMLCAIGTVGLAQTKTKTPTGTQQAPSKNQTVPDNIRTHFSDNYPNVRGAEWSTSGNNHSVKYRNDQNLQQVITYDNNARVIRQDQQLDEMRIPTGVTSYYNTNYPNQTDYMVWSSQDNAGNVTYYSTYNNQMIYFDATGNYLRAEKLSPATPMK